MKQENFLALEGTPIAYWVKESFINDVANMPTLKNFARPRSGLTTSDNTKYLRYWYEVETFNKNIKSIEYPDQTFDKWVPLNGGGTYRKWYGNNLQVIYWKNKGEAIKSNPKATMANPDFQFKAGVTWSKISGTNLSVRRTGEGYVFSAVGLKAFPPKESINYVCGFLNSALVRYFVPIYSSNFTILSGDIAKYPIKEKSNQQISDNVEVLCKISKTDWDSKEISWDFKQPPLFVNRTHKDNLENSFVATRNYWHQKTDEMKQLEEENNKIFIKAYHLISDLDTEVPIDEITLSFNSYYRYDSKKSEEELEALLLADTMKEFIGYSVGCMVGRYSLEKEGLILANAGETLEDYLRQVPEPSFMPDEDNVIPVLEGEWFQDDIAERFKDFLKVTYGKANFEENLAFIEAAIGRDIRNYFVKDFYNHHVKMYKNRPIYWLFSSSKGSFNALIYMHRYRPDTLSVILNDYLLQYHDKLTAHKALLETRSISVSASQSEKTKAIKEIDQINKVLSELKEYEDEILYPLAAQQIEIDLDDGVKVNYNKFGRALKKVTGLSV